MSSTSCLKQIFSYQKCFILQNHFQLDNSYAFPEAILHERQRSCKFEYPDSSFVIACLTTHCIVLTVQCFYLWRNKDPSVLSPTRNKRVAITFHENQRLNLGNQYHKDATEVAPGIIEKFEEPHNIIPHQNDETITERQIKCPKIVEALDKILYLIEKQ